MNVYINTRAQRSWIYSYHSYLSLLIIHTVWEIVNLNIRVGTVCTLFVNLCSSSGEFHGLVRAPATKRPSDETAGDEVSPRQNGWRRSVPAMKWMATKCPGGDETAATKSPVPYVQVYDPRLSGNVYDPRPAWNFWVLFLCIYIYIWCFVNVLVLFLFLCLSLTFITEILYPHYTGVRSGIWHSSMYRNLGNFRC